jgi:Tfp pilus assembly protein PilN
VTTTTTPTRLVTLPRVNLLPPEIGERKKLQQVQLGLALAVVVAVAGIGLVYESGGSAVTNAKNNLASAQVQNTAMQAKLAKLQFVSQEQTVADQTQALLTQATATEVHWSDYLADLSVITPAHDWFTSITFSESLPVGSIASPAAAPSVVGAVTFSGNGLAHNDLATWLDVAATEKGFVDPYFTNSTESYIGKTKIVTFQSTVGLTSGALVGSSCSQQGTC